jgi:hypothetical protein
MPLKNPTRLGRLMACVVVLVALGEPVARAGAMDPLLRACPDLEQRLTAESSQLQDTEVTLEPGWWSSAELLPRAGATVLRLADAYGESFRSVRLPSCSLVGFSWHFIYEGGYHLTPQVQPVFFRDGKRVGWHELGEDERALLLEGMRASLGSPEAMTWAGYFYRQRQAEVSPRSPEAPRGGLVQRTKIEFILPGKPRSEGRTFTPCTPEVPRCIVPTTGSLFFGTRLTKRGQVGGKEVYSLSFASASNNARSISVARVHPAGDRLVIHDRQRDAHAILFDAFGAKGLELIRVPGRKAFRIEFRSGAFPVTYTRLALLDLEKDFLYELSSASVSQEDAPALLERNARCHVACGEDGACEAVDFARVLESEGNAGVETVPAEGVLALGERCGSPAVKRFAVTRRQTGR